VPPSVDVQRENVLEPNEIVTEILLPRPQPGLRSAYRKVRARGSWDFALAGVALALQFRGQTAIDGRIVLSGAAPVPWRSRTAEAAILGRTVTPERAAAAGTAAMQRATPLKRNGYKVPLFKGVIEEELLRLARA
ncbi:MAG: xanthine dehydrogenase family protein subunit M, partial [Gemmatimonadota bacterium]|nr:xanthine dehydrogenase family protein subunit M [Gemmatimonadota bacterium]